MYLLIKFFQLLFPPLDELLIPTGERRVLPLRLGGYRLVHQLLQVPYGPKSTLVLLNRRQQRQMMAV